MSSNQLRVMHFVAGGFTGSTSVAIDLVRSTANNPQISSFLVLRKRPTTDMARFNKLIDEQLPVTMISSRFKLITILQLYRLCKKFQPDVLVAHGYTEHLWGRYAGLLAKVPHLVHVEHNSRENYSRWRLFQAHWLSKYTDAIIGCAQGVKVQLEKLKFPAEKISVIPNGIELERFSAADHSPFETRVPGIVMPARFGKQKDHLTLVRAIALLRDKGIQVPVIFAGMGHNRYFKAAQAMTQELNLSGQITFAGHCSNLPELLIGHQLCVLSTNWEGMPIALTEGMAPGCAVIGTAVPGVQEMIQHNQDGLLVPPKSPYEMAEAIEKLLQNTDFAKRIANNARARAVQEFSLITMRERYEEVYYSLVNRKTTNNYQS